jgi:hypothetical protein
MMITCQYYDVMKSDNELARWNEMPRHAELM